MKQLYTLILVFALACTLSIQSSRCVSTQDQLDAQLHELLAKLKTFTVPTGQPLMDIRSDRPTGIIIPLVENMQQLRQAYKQAGAIEPTIIFQENSTPLLFFLDLGISQAALSDAFLSDPEIAAQAIQLPSIYYFNGTNSLEIHKELEQEILDMVQATLPYLSSCLQERIQRVIDTWLSIVQREKNYFQELDALFYGLRELDPIDPGLGSRADTLTQDLINFLDAYGPYMNNNQEQLSSLQEILQGLNVLRVLILQAATPQQLEQQLNLMRHDNQT